MLPYTTYTIPESRPDKTGFSAQKIFFFYNEPPDEAKLELLGKIGQVVSRDFKNEIAAQFVDPNAPVSLTEMTQKAPQLIICFGVQPANIGVWIDLTTYGLRMLDTGVLIYCASLAEMEKSPAAKKALWKDLQTYLEYSQHG